MVIDMARGGRRARSGRPNSEPTKQVRIPVSMADISRSLVDVYKARLLDKLHEDRWFLSAPEHEKERITLENICIENMSLGEIISGFSWQLCIVADAKHPNGEGVSIWVKI